MKTRKQTTVLYSAGATAERITESILSFLFSDNKSNKKALRKPVYETILPILKQFFYENYNDIFASGYIVGYSADKRIKENRPAPYIEPEQVTDLFNNFILVTLTESEKNRLVKELEKINEQYKLELITDDEKVLLENYTEIVKGKVKDILQEIRYIHTEPSDEIILEPADKPKLDKDK